MKILAILVAAERSSRNLFFVQIACVMGVVIVITALIANSDNRWLQVAAVGACIMAAAILNLLSMRDKSRKLHP